MLEELIRISLRNRALVILLTILMAALGINSALNLPIDAVPDMTNTQVQIVTKTGGLSPLEVERYVTYPVETGMSGMPRVDEIRSVSQLGISSVTVVFEDGTDIYRARQLITERLVDVASRIPPGYGTPEIGPLTTALGEILQFEVRGEGYTPMDLRTILEWRIVPLMRQVRGVTEVNSHGGFYKSFEIRPNPDQLNTLQISLEELFEAVELGEECDVDPLGRARQDRFPLGRDCEVATPWALNEAGLHEVGGPTNGPGSRSWPGDHSAGAPRVPDP